MASDPERNDPLDIDPPRNELLARITPGMTVLDAVGETVGTVEFVKMADPSDPDATPRRPWDDRGLIDRIVGRDEDDTDLLDALIGADGVTERMRRSGYVKIDTAGLFAGDTYVVPRQIASVNAQVRLTERTEALRHPT